LSQGRLLPATQDRLDQKDHDNSFFRRQIRVSVHANIWVCGRSYLVSFRAARLAAPLLVLRKAQSGSTLTEQDNLWPLANARPHRDESSMERDKPQTTHPPLSRYLVKRR